MYHNFETIQNMQKNYQIYLEKIKHVIIFLY